MSQCEHPAGKCNNADDCAEPVCLSAMNRNNEERSAAMTEDRFKQIMARLGMPNSRSLLEALRQVANEAAQEALASRVAGDGWQPTQSVGQVQPPPRRP